MGPERHGRSRVHDGEGVDLSPLEYVAALDEIADSNDANRDDVYVTAAHIFSLVALAKGCGEEEAREETVTVMRHAAMCGRVSK